MVLKCISDMVFPISSGSSLRYDMVLWCSRHARQVMILHVMRYVLKV